MKGTVKWYNARKGYGFITAEGEDGDIFVHATSLKNSGLKKLFTGSEVTFEIEKDEKGKRAKSLKVTKEIKEETKKPEKETKKKEKEAKKPEKEAKKPEKTAKKPEKTAKKPEKTAKKPKKDKKKTEKK